MLIRARTIHRWNNQLAGRWRNADPIKTEFLRRPFLCLLAVVILAACGLAARALAQEQATQDRIYVVTHVDIIPPKAADGHEIGAAIRCG